MSQPIHAMDAGLARHLAENLPEAEVLRLEVIKNHPCHAPADLGQNRPNGPPHPPSSPNFRGLNLVSRFFPDANRETNGHTTGRTPGGKRLPNRAKGMRMDSVNSLNIRVASRHSADYAEAR